MEAFFPTKTLCRLYFWKCQSARVFGISSNKYKLSLNCYGKLIERLSQGRKSRWLQTANRITSYHIHFYTFKVCNVYIIYSIERKIRKILFQVVNVFSLGYHYHYHIDPISHYILSIFNLVCDKLLKK